MRITITNTNNNRSSDCDEFILEPIHNPWRGIEDAYIKAYGCGNNLAIVYTGKSIKRFDDIIRAVRYLEDNASDTMNQITWETIIN